MRFQKSLLIAMAVILGSTAFLHAQAPGRDLKKEAAIWAQLDLRAPGLVEPFKQATTLMDQQKYPESAALYQKIVDAQPEFDPAVRRLSICLVLGGNAAKGLPLAEKAVQMNRSPENLASLAELLVFQGKGSPVPLQTRDRAFGLVMEAQKENANRDIGDTILVAGLALDLDKEKEFREATVWLMQKHPELAESHYFNAVLAAADSHWSVAEQEIRQAEKLGLDHKIVDEFLKSGVQARATAWRYARYSSYLIAVWAAGLLLLFFSGKALSKRVIESTTGGPVAMAAEAGLRRTYRRLINLAGLYYYISQPVVIILMVMVSASVIYGFYMFGMLPGQLIAVLGVMAIMTIYFMIKTLFVKRQIQFPGRALAHDEAPGLWVLTKAVAGDLGTRPVDEIRITPGTDVAVYEQGTRSEKSVDAAKRVLILGVGVLNGFRVGAFRAVLAHEYGHFANRDTAGGEIALRVNQDMMALASAMIAAKQNNRLNLGFYFLRLYHFLFRRISHGASRLQEVMADRVAAMKYGADAFEEGLRHVIRRAAEFSFVANREARLALESGAAINNLYNLAPEEASSVEQSIQKILSGPTSEDDTHPCPNDRFRLAHEIITSKKTADDSMVWDLFANREALTAEMTQVVAASLRPVPAPKKAPLKKGILARCWECGGRIVIGGYKEGAERYCSAACYTASPFRGLCEECTSQTMEKNPGGTYTMNGIGTRLRASGKRCPKCHSVLAKKWFVVLFLPIIPLGAYRARWIDQQQYFGRRLKQAR